VKKIRELDLTEFPNLIETKNYFVFSYLTGGMNFVDMAKLTWENIKNDRIEYTRSKTKSHFSFKVTSEVKQILTYYKKINKGTKYVFPILLKDELTIEQIYNRKDKILKKFNKELKKIAELCGIDSKITSYVSRHSFASNLKEKGFATEIITESMGHKNPQYTQVYLKELDKSIIDNAIDSL
jgi:integrase